MNISVLGCGRWGTFLAWYANKVGHNVMLWGRESSRNFIGLKETRRNDYLYLPEDVGLTNSLEKSISFAEIIIISISAQELRSWAGLVPGNNESAGKRKSSKTKNGNKYLKSALIEAAHSVRGSKNYLGALYRRTAARKGKKRAGIVVAHAILRISYYLLTRGEMYVDLGEDYFDKQKKQSIVRHSLRRLESLGYTVSIVEQEAS